MKIALLADYRWVHTVNWANGLAKKGHEVHLITMHNGVDKLNSEVILHRLNFTSPHGYFLNLFAVRQILKKIQVDILNVHYASGYGTLGMLVNWHPMVLSVWGSDVYEFPEKSIFHKKLIAHNLKIADAVFSTSETMAKRVKDFLGYGNEVLVTPFGIDTERFCKKRNNNDRSIVLGTVKKLEEKYGIDVLLNVFKKIKEILEKRESEILDSLEFLIVGGGSELSNLKLLARDLNISDMVRFEGHVPHEQVPKFLNELDIYYALSTSDSESFGVAILEASACELPVIVSDRGGLWEVVEEGLSGFIFDTDKVNEIAERSIDIIEKSALRKEMGIRGRQFVEQKYSWDKTLLNMEKSYELILNNNI